ncbi:MAG: 23S rRNA (adenine(2503)-C(2))-methyltransferase RlmN [Spirochaetaceae bacterium]|nr:23S rRNA (adenine(2503)-C(2))-methyltransferase RlmN [Spirochaetaceae bacterium]
MNDKIPLAGLPLDELEEALSPAPAFRARQVFRWIAGGAESFDQMSNLSEEMRRELDGRFLVRQTKVVRRFESGDGSLKLQIELADGARIETMALRDGAKRRTACLSTQSGCAMACVFCKTGALRLSRNLSSAEIVEQALHLKDAVSALSNIVFMGMGEPLLNLDALRRAIAVLTGGGGGGGEGGGARAAKAAFSTRRITVSTCGVVKGILSLAEEGPAVRLAVSLTTADEALRRRLMPVAAEANPLPALKDALKRHQAQHTKRITLEAVILGGVNTRTADIEALKAFAEGLDVLINAIPWNPVDGARFEGKPLCAPSGAEIARFAAALERAGLKTVVRRSKGARIAGACGQLGAPTPVDAPDLGRPGAPG